MSDDERLPWFACDPKALLGALAGMRPPEGYVYTIVLLRIYEMGGACPDTLDALANRTRFNKRIVSDALDSLFKAGRLYRGEGGIRNPKADSVIEESKALREERKTAGAKGGKRTAEKAKQNQQNEGSKAGSKKQQSSTHLHLQEQDSLFSNENRTAERSEEQVPKAPVYTDSKHELWGEGVPILISLGMKEKLARQMVGTWLKAARDDAQQVLAAIQRARDNRVQGPLEWITRAINGGNDAENRRRGGGREGFAILAERARREQAARRADDAQARFGDAGDFGSPDGHRDSSGGMGGVARGGTAALPPPAPNR